MKCDVSHVAPRVYCCAHLDDILLLHLQRPRGVVVLDPAASVEEGEGAGGHPEPGAVGLLQPPHRSGLQQAEVDLVTIIY